MFEGTTKWFKILYFLTAMLPAYLLFLLQIVDNLEIKDIFNKVSYLEFIVAFGILNLFVFLIASILKRKLKETINTGLTREYKASTLVNSKNGDVVSFLLGVIFPSVVTFSSNIYVSIIVFLLLQVLIYKLMVNSSNIFPNVLMIIFFKMNIYEIEVTNIEDVRYIITFNQKRLITNSVMRIGNSPLCQTYVMEGEFS